ncbi:PAS domain-containing protein [Atopobacter sp. AH10]|uniref:two-component system histidine kinase PnpS n=1 Tax=Atopobacter sp. AH10 TaxID=2315861 RepID=UPI000EF2132E|nr:ATP-binding protein [Atopobacter sp. AH10]RLK63074.1 PAS domain-containing protein [Atopobacter sp. AH10]
MIKQLKKAWQAYATFTALAMLSLLFFGSFLFGKAWHEAESYQASEEIAKQQMAFVAKNKPSQDDLVDYYSSLNKSQSKAYWLLAELPRRKKKSKLLVKAPYLTDQQEKRLLEIKTWGRVKTRYFFAYRFKIKNLAVFYIIPSDPIRFYTTNRSQPILAFLFLALLGLHWHFKRKIHLSILPLEHLEEAIKKLSLEPGKEAYKEMDFRSVDEVGGQLNRLARTFHATEERLEKARKQVELLMEHSIMGVLLLDDQYRVLVVNKAAEQLLHKSRRQMRKKSYTLALESYGLQQLIQKAYESQEVQKEEVLLYYASEKMVEATALPIDTVESHEEEVAMIVALYDISSVRQLEKMRSEFVANASHELRTPLTAIKGFAETLMDKDLRDDESLEECLSIIYKESVRVSAIVEDILTLSRLESHAESLSIESVDLKELLESVFCLLQDQAELAGVRLINHIKAGSRMETDPNRLKQILLNLVTNGVNYNNAPGYVEVSLEENQEAFRLLIKDDGIGIPEEAQSRIFERFYRVDKARGRKMGGTGLGLSIVKHLVKSLGASIEVNSTMGVGTCFTITWLKKTKD